MSQTVRDSQRVPRSCTACSRRKIKCSKTVPCTGCIRRGESSSCAREVVRVNGKFAVAVDVPSPTSDSDQCKSLEDENKGLLARIQHLEALILQNEQSSERTPSHNSDSSTDVCMPQEDIISTFHGLHVDPTPNSSSAGQRSSCNNRSSDYLLSLLPIRESSEQVARFSLETLGWIHCALNVPRFLKEHEHFWNALSSRGFHVLDDHSWIALYLSVLCVGFYFMESEQISHVHFLHEGYSGPRRSVSNLGPQAAQKSSFTYYEAALRELDYANFLGKPCLSTVQTLAILSLVHRSFGEVEKEYNLLSVAISTAKLLNMDRLGREHSTMDKMMISTCWVDRETREVGRRLWWTLVICDWMISTPSRSCSIVPGSFTSVLSIEDDQSHQDIVFKSPDNVNTTSSPLEYHLFMARVASIVQPYKNHRTNISIQNISKSLLELDRSVPSYPSPNEMPMIADEMLSPQVKLRRSLTSLLVNACRINLCLVALPSLLDTGKDEDGILLQGRSAASDIVEQRRDRNCSYYDKAWGTRFALLSAGIYLMLDLICFQTTKSSQEIEDLHRKAAFTIETLERGSVNPREGAGILHRLIRISQAWPSHKPIDKNGLFHIMSLAARRESTKVEDHDMISADLIRHVENNELQVLGNQAPSTAGYDMLGEDHLFSMDSHFPVDFNAMGFDLFHQMPSDSLEWSANILPDILPGAYHNGSYSH